MLISRGIKLLLGKLCFLVDHGIQEAFYFVTYIRSFYFSFCFVFLFANIFIGRSNEVISSYLWMKYYRLLDLHMMYKNICSARLIDL